ncbi:hypothetical protein [Streptomyces sp. NPDC004296]
MSDYEALSVATISGFTPAPGTLRPLRDPNAVELDDDDDGQEE